MFCNQCEQTVQDGGCTKAGVCGKDHKTASLQDLLTFAVRGLSQVAIAGRRVGVNDADVNRFTLKAIFSTLTNVNFDPDRLQDLIKEAVQKREELRRKVERAGGNCQSHDPAVDFQPPTDLAGLIEQGPEDGDEEIEPQQARQGEQTVPAEGLAHEIYPGRRNVYEATTSGPEDQGGRDHQDTGHTEGPGRAGLFQQPGPG